MAKSPRKAAPKSAATPPKPPIKEPEVEEDEFEEEERQTLLLEDERYYVDELSEEAQDIVKLLQHLNPKAETAKKEYMILERSRAGLIEDLRVEILGE